MNDDLQSIAAHFVETLSSSAPSLRLTKDIILTHFKDALKPTLAEMGIVGTAGADQRARIWHVRAQYWTSSNGADVDTIALEGETAPSGVHGFAQVASWLIAGARHVHGDYAVPHDIGTLALMRRLDNLRPSITRGGGRANMRIAYRDRDGRACQLHATVSRDSMTAAPSGLPAGQRHGFPGGLSVVPIGNAPSPASAIEEGPAPGTADALRALLHGRAPYQPDYSDLMPTGDTSSASDSALDDDQ